MGPSDGMLGAPAQIEMWNALYRDMTGTYKLSPKPALMGLSRQGLAIARWAARNCPSGFSVLRAWAKASSGRA